MKNFWKSGGFKVLLCLAAFFLGMIIYTATTGSGTITGAVLSPLQNAVSTVTGGVGDFFSGLFASPSALTKENEELKTELAELRKSQAELNDLRRQNALYKDFLGLKEEHPDYKFADARVIAVDPTDGYGNFTVGAGSLDGVAAGNAVVTPDGLVGVVSDVGLNYATVRTLLDPSLTVSAYNSRTREDGLTGGSAALAQKGLFQLTKLDRNGTATAGDMILTYGGKYPEGLLIGEIQSVAAESDGLSKTAVVRPFADIRSVSEVFIIVDFEGAQR